MDAAATLAQASWGAHVTAQAPAVTDAVVDDTTAQQSTSGESEPTAPTPACAPATAAESAAVAITADGSASCAGPARVSANGGGAVPSLVGARGDPPMPAAAVVVPGGGAPTAVASDTPADTPADAPVEPLGVGARVELVGLGAAHFNGIPATVTGPLNDQGRWAVTTGERRVLSVRPANLRVVAPVAAAAEPVDGADSSAEPSCSSPGATTTTATAPPDSTTSVAHVAATPVPTAASLKFCAWARCGKPLPPGQRMKCDRCKRAWYCGRACQKKHWKEGGHKLVCEEAPSCTICLDGGDEPLPMQRGCACRGDAGLAHVACQARAAAHQGAGGWNDAWHICPTCGQFYTGGMQLGLAHEAVRRLETRAPEDGHRLAARLNLGDALKDTGDFAGAEVLLRDVLAIRRRAWGRANPATRATARILADVLGWQGCHAGAVTLYREVLAATPAKEQEDQNTLAAKGNLAKALSVMGDHAEAEALLRGVQATKERLHGPADARVLTTTGQLGPVLHSQGKHAEAEAVYRTTLAGQRRVLGPEHPETLRSASNLAGWLSGQGQHAEAEELLWGVLAAQRRTKGPGHADTLRTASSLSRVQEAAGTQ